MHSKILKVFVNAGQVLALCSAAVLATPSYAVETHIHTGASCVPQQPGYVYERDQSGSVRNTSNVNQVWECPLMRRTANHIFRVFVYAYNHGAGSNDIFCVLRSKGYDGDHYSGVLRTAAKGGGYMSFHQGVATLPSGAVSLRCKLPAKNSNGQTSSIVNYIMEE